MISAIARHFPPNISAILVGTTSYIIAADRLRQADYYFNSFPQVDKNKNFTKINNNNIRSVDDTNRQVQQNKNSPSVKFQKKDITCLNEELENEDDNVSGNELDPQA